MTKTPTGLIAELPPLDAITVQSAGLRKLDDGTYASTLYTDSDDFGMLGGFMRVRAAQELYWQDAASTFVFCNGRSAKQIAKFGPQVPTDAEIYADEFKIGIAQDERSQSAENARTPRVLLEDKSVNTVASIGELLSMCAVQGWEHIGLVSSDYHIPRIRALCGLIFEKLGYKPVDISFISAEAIVKESRPGIYDAEIDSAYQTPLALQRISNEKAGCEDIAAGRYHIGEFQLAPRQP